MAWCLGCLGDSNKIFSWYFGEEDLPSEIYEWVELVDYTELETVLLGTHYVFWLIESWYLYEEYPNSSTSCTTKSILKRLTVAEYWGPIWGILIKEGALYCMNIYLWFMTTSFNAIVSLH